VFGAWCPFPFGQSRCQFPRTVRDNDDRYGGAVRAVLAVALVVSFEAVAGAQTTTAPTVPRGPDFKVQVWGDIVADFSNRVDRYAELRRAAEVGVPPLAVTDHWDEITRSEVALAARISRARGRARQGEIFTPLISAEFRNALRPIVDDKTRAVIMDDNPGSFTHHIDVRYPKTRSYSTVPANVLALLPRLPADIEYRFLGPHLILLDVRANVIIDRMRCAIRCDD